MPSAGAVLVRQGRACVLRGYTLSCKVPIDLSFLSMAVLEPHRCIPAVAAHCGACAASCALWASNAHTQGRFEGAAACVIPNAAGDAFLAITGSARIKVYDRDGRERGESLQGDMYIRDLRNTKGHVSPCTNGAWHPLDR